MLFNAPHAAEFVAYGAGQIFFTDANFQKKTGSSAKKTAPWKWLVLGKVVLPSKRKLKLVMKKPFHLLQNKRGLTRSNSKQNRGSPSSSQCQPGVAPPTSVQLGLPGSPQLGPRCNPAERLLACHGARERRGRPLAPAPVYKCNGKSGPEHCRRAALMVISYLLSGHLDGAFDERQSKQAENHLSVVNLGSQIHPWCKSKEAKGIS